MHVYRGAIEYLLSGGTDGVLKAWRVAGDTITRAEQAGELPPGRCSAAAALSTGHVAWSSPKHACILSIDPHGQVRTEVTLPEEAHHCSTLVELPHGRLMGNPISSAARIWGMGGQWPCLQVLTWDCGLDPMILVPRGRLAGTAGRGVLRVWDPQEPQAQHTLEHTAPKPQSIQALLRVEGDLVAAAVMDSTQCLYTLHVDSGAWGTPKVPPGECLDLACLPDGRIAGPCAADGALAVVDWQHDSPPLLLQGHAPPTFGGASVLALTTLDSGRLVSGGIDNTLRLWHIQEDSGEQVAQADGVDAKANPRYHHMGLRTLCSVHRPTVQSCLSALRCCANGLNAHYAAALRRASCAPRTRRRAVLLCRARARE